MGFVFLRNLQTLLYSADVGLLKAVNEWALARTVAIADQEARKTLEEDG